VNTRRSAARRRFLARFNQTSQAFCKECNGTTEQIETCGHRAIAPRGFLRLWVQQALAGALAQRFAWQMAPGGQKRQDARVTVNSVYLRGRGPADPDPMRGVATGRGSAAAQRTTRLRATSTYIPSPVDQVLVEQAFKGRVPLSQAFAYRLARRRRR
jgi:hypothetical protein